MRTVIRTPSGARALRETVRLSPNDIDRFVAGGDLDRQKLQGLVSYFYGNVRAR